jgi:hypothetical protein
MGEIVSMGRIISSIINSNRTLNEMFYSWQYFPTFWNETIYEPVIKSGYIDISYGILSVKIYRVTLLICIYRCLVSEKDGLNL